jgi:hypothetical protein
MFQTYSTPVHKNNEENYIQNRNIDMTIVLWEWDFMFLLYVVRPKW